MNISGTLTAEECAGLIAGVLRREPTYWSFTFEQTKSSKGPVHRCTLHTPHGLFGPSHWHEASDDAAAMANAKAEVVQMACQAEVEAYLRRRTANSPPAREKRDAAFRTWRDRKLVAGY